MRDDDDQREGFLRERRTFDLLARLLVAFRDEETRARREEKEEQRNRFLIDCVTGEAARSLLGKRKTMERRENQENPNRLDHASSSSTTSSSTSLSSVESEKRLAVVPIRAVPIRELKPPVRQPVIRRERGETPEWLVNLMREEGGVDAKLVIEKDLMKSDLATNLTRLLIPWNQMVDMDFLSEEEQRNIDDHFNKRRLTGVDVILVDSNRQKWNLNLRRWDMKNSCNYVLVTGWTKVFRHNRLQVNQKIHLWSFHSKGRLYLALVPPQQPQAPVVAQPLALDADQDRVVAQPLPQATDGASSSAMASAVTRDSDDIYEREAEEESNRRFANFPKRRRTGRVPVPEPTRDSGELNLMAAEIAPMEAVQETISWTCRVPVPETTRESGEINWMAAEVAPLEAVQETYRWTSPLCADDLDLELRL
ncbi:unnamed protein product [Microthlaspi erraticum]|uniref:TF-B3 domain-containing protein n=1 Tax=Microthlaspi erraticum TaxID=1685480 RepID=A0A6D2KCJ7_9BRAS|nr:unnamed protein product [Microthlaspi erraticum]